MRLSAANDRQAFAALDERQLVTAAQAGSADCFGELVSRYEVGLLEFLRHRTATIEDAEDLVQETFARAYLKLEQFSGQWRFSTWLYTIARRLAISSYRKRRFVPLPAEYESSQARPEDMLMRREMNINLWAVAKSLPASQYEAVWLKYAEGMSVKQIARVMNKSQVHVKVLLHRGRVRMCKRLKRTAGGGSVRNAEAARENYNIPESAGV